MNILFSPWSEYCIYPGEEDEWPMIWHPRGPRPRGPIFPGQSCFMPRGFGDLSRCLILNQFFKKFNFSRHIMYLRKTRAESFFQKILWILLYAKLLCISGSCGRPCNSILYIRRKLYDKSFLLKHFYYKAHLQSLICSQQRNHRRNIFPYKFQIAWDWHLDAIMPAASCLYDK